MASPPNFIKGVGRLATDRYDFQNHLEGINPPGFTDFRHTADQIDMNPSVLGGASTVQATLGNIANFINGESGATQGFITVGDGYDTYHAANGTVNYDPSIPSLDKLLNPILAQITAYQNSNTPVSANYERIKDGGIIILKAGTYIIKNTINVPAGITLMGEGYGTKVVNATALTLTLPPHINSSAIPLPLFNILPDLSRVSDGASINNDKFMFARETRICHMVIADNFVEPTILGDVNYLLPQNRVNFTDSFFVPLIQQQTSSSLILDNLCLIGRAVVNQVGGDFVTQSCSGAAYLLDTTNAAPAGTRFKMSNSIIDGFAFTYEFLGTAGSNDYFEVTNCQVRGYGIADQCAIFLTGDNNVKIVNNTVYCEGFFLTGAIPTPPSVQAVLLTVIESLTIPTLQARSKILVASNNINVDKTSNVASSIVIFEQFIIDIIPTYATSLVYGNSINGAVDEFVIEVNDLLTLQLTNSSTLTSNLTIQSNGTLDWDVSTSPALIQNATSSGAGASFIISSQATSAAGQLGGDLILNSGNSGSGVTTSSAARLQGINANGANGGTLVVYRPQGVNQGDGYQHQINGVYQSVVHTLAGSPHTHDATAMTIHMPNNSGAFIDICWVRYDLTAGSYLSNKAALIASCNNTGTITTSSPVLYTGLSGGRFDTLSGIIDIGNSANTVIIIADNQANAQDWQFTANINLM